jgi:hypothetical protein
MRERAEPVNGRGDDLGGLRAAIGWAVLTAGGLLVSVAAVMAASSSGGATTPASRLVLHVPDTVALGFAVALGLAALTILWLLWPRGLRRRRRRGDEEFELYHEPPPRSPWLALVLLLVFALAIAGVGGLLWLDRAPLGNLGPGVRADGPDVVEAPQPVSPARPRASAEAFDAALTGLLIVVGGGLVGVLAWLAVGDRLARWWAGPIFAEDVRPWRLAVAEGLQSLRTEPDARRAIVGCYRHFERALAAARQPRAPWQTPTEFMRAVLGRLPLPGEAVRLLTGLFELSRFSERRLGPTERDVACDCLQEIQDALDGIDRHATRA